MSEAATDDERGKPNPHRALFDALDAQGLLEYGSFIPGELVREVLGLEMPALGTKAQFDAISLSELGAIDGVREILLNLGKYIAGSSDGYRILTPGENSLQIDRYLSHAQNKIRRARKLERTSPAMTNGRPSQHAARRLMIEKTARKKDKRPPSN